MYVVVSQVFRWDGWQTADAGRVWGCMGRGLASTPRELAASIHAAACVAAYAGGHLVYTSLQPAGQTQNEAGGRRRNLGWL